MQARARRLLLRGWPRAARRALLALCLVLPSMAASDAIVAATYEGPTTRYAHGVLGDAIEHTTLSITLASGKTQRFTLLDTSVFEDTQPRLTDLDGDGMPEVITVESNASQGARLAIYGAAGRITATPYIGTRYRWLAPLGAADIDADGTIEIAYIDRPHLAKTLRIWRYTSGSLTQVAQLPGLTNHRIGERDIAGGIRTCKGTPEMILADGTWSNLMSVTFDGEQIKATPISKDTTRAAFARAMDCQS